MQGRALRVLLPGHRGIGTALIERAEYVLRAKGVRMLQVKTLGPSRPSEHYAGTRFSERLRVVPLEELQKLRSEGSLCLLLAKPLTAG